MPKRHNFQGRSISSEVTKTEEYDAKQKRLESEVWFQARDAMEVRWRGRYKDEV